MDVVVTAKLSNEKLASKLIGLQNSSVIGKIYIVRAQPIQGEKIVSVVPSNFLSSNIVLFELWRFFTLLRLMGKEEVSLVIGIQFFLHGLVAVVAALLTRKKSIVWLIGSDVMIHAKKKGVRYVFRWVISHASRVLIMGPSMRKELSFLKDELIDEMQSFIDPDIYRERTDVNEYWDVGFVGNLEPVKRVDLLLSAIAELNKEGLDLRLVVAGAGTEESNLKRQCLDFGIEKQVDFIGYQTDISSVLNKIKLLVLTSESEGLPAILLEASFCGVPSLATNVGEISNHFYDYNHVEMFSNDDTYTIAKRIREVLSDAQGMAKMRKDAARLRADYLQYWGVKGQVERWERNISLALDT